MYKELQQIINKQNPIDFWSGDFGDQYTARNRVDWRNRIPFWKRVIDFTGARSVHEVGCNAGWNLSAIHRICPDVNLTGNEINITAAIQARSAGFKVHGGSITELLPPDCVELVFTAGVLIHVSPEDLPRMMQDIIDTSCDYVLAIEYAADKEEEVEYRGYSKKLWRRPYGKLYQDMDLKLINEWDAGEGFDKCTAWLLRKI